MSEPYRSDQPDSSEDEELPPLFTKRLIFSCCGLLLVGIIVIVLLTRDHPEKPLNLNEIASKACESHQGPGNIAADSNMILCIDGTFYQVHSDGSYDQIDLKDAAPGAQPDASQVPPPSNRPPLQAPQGG